MSFVRRFLPMLAVTALLAVPASAAATGQHAGLTTRAITVDGERARVMTHSDTPALARDNAAQQQRMRRAIGRAEMASMERSGVESRALPTSWCGDDRRADGAGTPDAPHIKVVYAYPTDRPNRLREWAPLLQGNVAAMRQTVAAASGGTRTLRFDMGSACGPAYVDIAVLALSRPRSAYLAGSGSARLDLVDKEVRQALPPTAGVANHLVFADSISSGGCDCLRGAAYSFSDSAPDATIHDHGGLTAVIWGVDGWSAPPSATTYFPLLFLHETTHTLGAVQLDAPHATAYGHCTDEYDVLCYDDGTDKPMAKSCPESGGVIDQALDCGGDDYFNPAPAPGSYLATHWNVYRSGFLEEAAPGAVPPVPPVIETPDAPAAKAPSATARLSRLGRATLAAKGRRLVVQPLTGKLPRWGRQRATYRLRTCVWGAYRSGKAVRGSRRCRSTTARTGKRVKSLTFSRPRGNGGTVVARVEAAVLSSAGRRKARSARSARRWRTVARTGSRSLRLALPR